MGLIFGRTSWDVIEKCQKYDKKEQVSVHCEGRCKNTLGGFLWGKKYDILGVEGESTPYGKVGVG